MNDFDRGCTTLVENCADLKSNDLALIVSNPATQNIGERIYELARAITPNVEHLTIPEFEVHGQEPPAEIAEKMYRSTVIFGLTLKSMAHTQARLRATSHRARYLSLPDYSIEVVQSPALHTDFRKLTEIADRVAKIFTDGNLVHLTSKLGTDLRGEITGRTGNSAPGWCRETGVLASPPDAEANVALIEDKTEGILVVDGSIPYDGIGLLQSPLRYTIEKGRIRKIEGYCANQLNALFDRSGNPLTRVPAELGIGLNPKAKLQGFMLEDEGCLGTAHIGMGSNATIGGKNRVPFHVDHIIRDITLSVDGRVVVQSGKVV